jgi:23S rRNA maturation-related 3'-5' exoribonuclease YhaM
MDGGVIHMMDIVNGIERCREIVSRDEDIDFYIVFAATKYLDNWDTSKSHHSLEVFTRYNRISDYKQSRQELILAQ